MNNLRYWFCTATCGDYRLEAKDDKSLLTVVNPTKGDREKLEPFLGVIKGRGLIPHETIISEVGETSILIPAPLLEMGPLLAEEAKGRAGTWTALRSESGVVLFDGVPGTVPADALAAVTMKAPTQGCPHPSPTAYRASQVLRAFLRPEQWKTFQQHGFVRAIGNLTGQAYQVWHRDEASKRNLSRGVTLESTGEPICVYDHTVPAEEEVLSLVLAVQNREGFVNRRIAPQVRTLFRPHLHRARGIYS